MTAERLAELEKIIRSYGSPNCWTGTSGTLATAAFELLAEVKRMRASTPINWDEVVIDIPPKSVRKFVLKRTP